MPVPISDLPPWRRLSYIVRSLELLSVCPSACLIWPLRLLGTFEEQRQQHLDMIEQEVDRLRNEEVERG